MHEKIIKKLKEAIKRIKKLRIEMYSIELHLDRQEKDKYILIIRDNNNKILFKKKLTEEEHEKLLENLETYNIMNDYFNKIKDILEELRKSRIIKEYIIKAQVNEENDDLEIFLLKGLLGSTTSGFYNIDVILDIDEKLAKEIKEDNELNLYLNYNTITDQYYLYITLKEIPEYVAFESLIYEKGYNILYVSKEVVEEIIKSFSKQ